MQEGNITMKYGTNLLSVALQKGKGFTTGKVYLFRFVNSRQETWSVKFTWQPTTYYKPNSTNP